MTHSTQPTDTTQAILYCRTASERQNEDHAGVSAQEGHCQAYATAKGYKVAQVISETCLEGTAADRPGLTAILDHMDAHPDETFVVIMVDPARIARDPDVCAAFRNRLRDRGARLECAALDLDDTPEAEFADRVLEARCNLEDDLAAKEGA